MRSAGQWGSRLVNMAWEDIRGDHEHSVMAAAPGEVWKGFGRQKSPGLLLEVVTATPLWVHPSADPPGLH